MAKRIEFTKTGPHWLDGQAWEGRVLPRSPEPEPATSTEPKKTRLFGRKEKPMPIEAKTKRVRILRGVASSRWSVEPGQCLDLSEDVVDQLLRSGSARLARPDEALTFTTTYDPQ